MKGARRKACLCVSQFVKLLVDGCVTYDQSSKGAVDTVCVAAWTCLTRT